MQTLPPVAQAVPAAPVIESAAAPAAVSVTAVQAAPGTTFAAPEATGLPMDFESIDAFMKGTGSLDVATESVGPSTVTPPPPAQTQAPGGPSPLLPAPVPTAVPEPQPAPAPAPAAPVAAPVAEPAPVEPPATPEPGEKLLPNRIHTAQFEPEAQAAMAMQASLNQGLRPGEPGFVGLAECLASVRGVTSPPPPPVTPPAPSGPSPIELAQTRISDAEATLEALEAKQAELTEYGSDLGEIKGQIKAAQKAVTQATVAASLAERDAADAQVAQRVQAIESDHAARLAVEAKVASQWQGVTDRTSPLGAKVQMLAKAMESPNHPDNAVLRSTNAAAIVTERAAILLAQEMEVTTGTPFAQALDSLRLKPSPAAAPAVLETGERRILPAGGNQGTLAPPPAPTESEVMADIGFDPDKLDAAMYGGQKAWRIGG